MKYALIPVLNKLAEWMDSNGYHGMTLDEFIDARSPDMEDSVIEWVWEIHNANSAPITIIEPVTEEDKIRELQK